MRRMFGGLSSNNTTANGESELHRLVNAATMPPYDADTSRPYSAPIQFATRRIAALAQDNPHVVQECIKQVKARIKCESSEIAANSLCLLDSLVHISNLHMQTQVVQKVLPRVVKMAQTKSTWSDSYPPPVALRAKSIVLGWALHFPLCHDFTAAAYTLGHPPPTPAPTAASAAPSRPAPRAPAAAHQAADDEEEIPAARARTTPNPPASNPAATGILLDAAAGAALNGTAPSSASRPDPTQSRFYQSALRSAEKAAAEERAQRSEQEHTDRAAALASRQESVVRHAAQDSSPPALSDHWIGAKATASCAAPGEKNEKVAECGGKDNLMTLETCKEVSDLFAVLVADAPRECKPNDVVATVSVRASMAHSRVQQLLRNSNALPMLLELYQALTNSLDTYASLGTISSSSSTPLRAPAHIRSKGEREGAREGGRVEEWEVGKHYSLHSNPSHDDDIPEVHTMSMSGDTGGSAISPEGHCRASEPWLGEAVHPHFGASMTTDELMSLLAAQDLAAAAAADVATLPHKHDDGGGAAVHARSLGATTRGAASAPTITPSLISSAYAKSSATKASANGSNTQMGAHKNEQVSLMANAYDNINYNLQAAERQVRESQDDSSLKAAKLNWVHALTRAAKVKLKHDPNGCLCAVALQKQVTGMDYMIDLQTLGEIEVLLESFLDQPV